MKKLSNMNRLWVRLSLMMSGVLFLVFFIQFLSITLDQSNRPIRPAGANGDPRFLDEAPQEEIVRRMFVWMGFSVVVGLAGGVVISRVVSVPITKLVRAAQQIGQGELGVRVSGHGSQEMVELAETFNKMAADLQRAEQLRSNLMADISHELRTPLTVLEGNLRAAVDHVITLDESEIANLYGQTRHLTRLVNDLREITLAESNQLPMEIQPTDLNMLLAETLKALEPLAVEKGVRLLDLTEKLPIVNADPSRLRQVFFNLLSNALRHTPQGGEISVSGTNMGSEVHLSVQDSGEGMEPEQQAAVFDRFYRGDKSRSRDTGGSGLGLTIVRAIINAHGGNISAFSPGKGQGSTFRFTIPITAN